MIKIWQFGLEEAATLILEGRLIRTLCISLPKDYDLALNL